jgi:hypothetical protein
MRQSLYVFALQVLVATCFSQTIYGIKSKSVSPQTGQAAYVTPATLYRFEDYGSSFARIAAITYNGTQIRADGLAYSSTLGLWCFKIVPDVSSTLYEIDPNTAAVISGGMVFNDRQIFGAAFDRYGQLWAIDQTDDELLKIDISSGTILQEIPLSFDGGAYNLDNSAGDICFDAMGQAYLVDHRWIYRLNIHTGVLTLLYADTTPYNKYLVGAVVPTKRPDTLIAFDVILTSFDNDDIFVYDLANLGEPDYLFEEILDDYNAGRGDFAADLPADLIVSSTFDTDADGWTGAGLSPSDFSEVLFTLPISWYADGYIGIDDGDEVWTTFSAPAKFLGDKSDWLGGEISLDLKNVTGGIHLDEPVVFLVAPGTVLCSPRILPSFTWDHYSIPLTPEGWHVNTIDGPEPDLAMMHYVLSDLQAMYIIGDYVSGTEMTYIDNVQMISGLSADSDHSGFVDLEDFAQFATQWRQTTCTAGAWCDGQDFNKSGAVNFSDLHYLLINWLQEMD